MTFTITLPLFLVIALAIVLGSVICLLAARFLLLPVLERLARKNGNLILESKWAWVYLIVGGPIIWLVTIKSYKTFKDAQKRGRDRAEARRQNPDWATA